MKRLYGIIAIAILAFVAMSCQPSIVGEWRAVKAEMIEDGEVAESEDLTGIDDGMILVFEKDGTLDLAGEAGYWKLVDNNLYTSDEPIIEESPDDTPNSLKYEVKHLDGKTLVMEEEPFAFIPAIRFTFERVK